jgi:hypothetical protein
MPFMLLLPGSTRSLPALIPASIAVLTYQAGQQDGNEKLPDNHVWCA